MSKQQNLFLIGLLGAGKTTIGHYLAQTLSLPFHDSDQEVEERAGVDINWIFDVEGEPGFRRREAKAIEELTQQEGLVLATGGGAILTESVRKALAARGIVIYLRCPLETLYVRTKNCQRRPLLQTQNPEETLARLFRERENFYLALADLTYDSDQQPVAKLGKQIIADVRERFQFRY